METIFNNDHEDENANDLLTWFEDLDSGYVYAILDVAPGIVFLIAALEVS
jgi:hypothetical protein